MLEVWQGNSLGLDASRVIDRKIYTDERVYAAEQERIFGKTWQWIAHETELPEYGDYVTATIAGRAVVAVRGDGDKITAFLNTCTHRGAVIAAHKRGKSDGVFTCIYHAWSFDVEGKLKSVPLQEAYGPKFEKKCYDIPQVRCETFAGHVFICFDKNAAPLEDFLADAGQHIQESTGDCVAIGRVRWKLEGNWKLWHENFRDNYHPMFAHMMLGLNYQGVKIEGRNNALSNGHSIMRFPSQGNPAHIVSAISKVTGRQMNEALSGPLARRQTGASPTYHAIMAIYPNLDFQFMSNPMATPYVQVVRPTAIDKAVIELVALGRKSDTPEIRAMRLANGLDGQTSAGKISGDDNEAAKRCSIGFTTQNEVRWSNMDRGQAPGAEGVKNDEYSLRAFYEVYRATMGDVLSALD